MKLALRIAVVLGLAVAIAIVVRAKNGSVPEERDPSNRTGTTRDVTPSASSLPRLVELGSTTCEPCKAMQAVIDGLREEFAGKLVVQFIDVEKDPAAARQFDVALIPTQIFLDADGNEVDRHMGFISRDDILVTFRKHGITFDDNAPGR